MVFGHGILCASWFCTVFAGWKEGVSEGGREVVLWFFCSRRWFLRVDIGSEILLEKKTGFL